MTCERCGGCGCSDAEGDDCPGVIWSDSPDRCICHALAEFEAYSAEIASPPSSPPTP